MPQKNFLPGMARMCVVALVICGIAMSGGCKNFFGDDTGSKNYSTEIAYTLKGAVEPSTKSGANPAKLAQNSTPSVSSRTAQPLIPAGITYTIKAVQGDKTVTTTTDSATFEIPLPSAGEWIITANGTLSGSDVIVFSGSAAITLTPESPANSNISIKVNPSTSGSGVVDLAITANAGGGIGYIEPEFTAADGIVRTLTSGTGFTLKTASPIPSGAYTLTLRFYDDSTKSNLLYFCTEVVNVFDGLTTDTWCGTAPYFTTDAAGATTFCITEQLVKDFALTTFFVKSSGGSDTDTGTYYDPLATIQNAVDKVIAANKDIATPGGVEYTIYVDGTFTNNIDNTALVDFEGLGDSTLLNLTIAGLGNTKAVLNGNGDDTTNKLRRVINAGSKADSSEEKAYNLNLTLKNLSVQKGFASSDSLAATGSGGGIFYGAANASNTLILDNCQVSGCQAYYGAGVFCKTGKLILQNNTVIGDKTKTTTATEAAYSNKALANGGGLTVNAGAQATIESGCVIAYNIVSSTGTTPGTLGGGGVYVATNSTFTMTGGTISYNEANYGGAVCNVGGTFKMLAGENGAIAIEHNTARFSGGGLYMANTTDSCMEAGTIARNKASYSSSIGGGGILLWSDATFTMSGGEITNNTTATYGGGVCVRNCSSESGATNTFTMTGGTISGNTAKYGGGIAVQGAPSSAKVSGTAVIGNANATSAPADADSADGGNVATSSGGGIYLNSSAKLEVPSDSNVQIKGNIAYSNSTNTYGGGIYVDTGSTLDMSSGTIAYNKSTLGGGGLYITNSTTQLNNCVVSNNISMLGGGACLTNSTCSLYVTDSKFINNTGDTGPAIRVYGATNSHLYMSGNVQINTPVYLQETVCNPMQITGPLSVTATVLLKKGGKVIENQTVLQGTDSYSLTQADCNKFVVAESSLSVALETDAAGKKVGVLRNTGIGVQDIGSVTFTPNATKFYSEENPVPLNYAESLSFDVSALDTTGNAIDLEDCIVTNKSLSLYQDGSPVAGKTATAAGNGECEVLLSGLFYGTYQLKMSVTINGKIFSKQQNMLIDEGVKKTVTLTTGGTALQDAINNVPANGVKYVLELSGTQSFSIGIRFKDGQNIALVPNGNVTLSQTEGMQLLTVAQEAVHLQLGSPTGTGTLTIDGGGSAISNQTAILAFDGTGATPTIVDIYQNVTIQDNKQNASSYCGGTIIVKNNATLNLRGCTIQNNTTKNTDSAPSNHGAGAIELIGSGAIEPTVNMYAGTTITKNTGPYIVCFNEPTGGGKGIFNWYGGVIEANTCTLVAFSDESNLNNMSGNTAN